MNISISCKNCVIVSIFNWRRMNHYIPDGQARSWHKEQMLTFFQRDPDLSGQKLNLVRRCSGGGEASRKKSAFQISFLCSDYTLSSAKCNLPSTMEFFVRWVIVRNHTIAAIISWEFYFTFSNNQVWLTLEFLWNMMWLYFDSPQTSL